MKTDLNNARSARDTRGDRSLRAALARVLLTVFLLSCLFTGIPYASAASGISPKLTGSVPEWAVSSSQRFTFDFSEEDLQFYSEHEAIRITSRPGMEVSGGRLLTKTDKSLGIATRGYLGDDYGIAGGSAGFRYSMTEGSIVVLLRVHGDSLKKSDSGLRITFENGMLTVRDDFTKKSFSADISEYDGGGKEAAVDISDKPYGVQIDVNGRTVMKIDYAESAAANSGYSVSNYSSVLTFRDASGTVLGVSENSTMQRAGHMVLVMEKVNGYVDDLYVDRTEIDQTLPEADTPRTINYGNWVAADDLSRTVRVGNAASAPRQDRTVGVFYFLCWVGAGIHVQDNTKIYLELGTDGLKKYLTDKGGEAYWAEPYFGYYRNTDAWVYRKHAYMLDAAGVDFIFLDVSNGEVFTEGHTILFDTWLQIRKEGGRTPQICFLTGDNSETFEKDMKNLRRGVYSEKNYAKYEELFFKWEGKPLVFGNISGVSSELKQYLSENFTVRGCWAWCDKDGYWSWLDETWNDGSGNFVQHKGRDLNGKFEQMVVTAGHHPSASKGRSYVNGVQPNNYADDFMFSWDESRKGLGFKSQWDAAISADPSVIMITGWNEWIAGNGRGMDYMALTNVKNVCYVDQFNPEFSRDIEPMKLRTGVGFGDNFYYQMVDNIRRYKGIDAPEQAYGQKTVSPGDTGAWAEVGPEYRDTIGDVEFRNTFSYDKGFKYMNGTGRNDFDYAKVSQDSDRLYFLVKTVNDVCSASDSTWMNLLIDTDMDHSTGWEGYDYILNRSRADGRVSVEKFDGSSWSSTVIGEAEYTVDGAYMTISADKKLFGFEHGSAANFDFKWTDNSTETGEIMEFMDLGDTAPNDRFNFRYISDAESYEKAIGGGASEKQGSNAAIIAVVAVTSLLVVAAAGTVVFVNRKKH